MIPQHVQNTHGGERHAKQVGTLSQGCYDKQATVAATVNTQAGTACISLFDQILSCGNEIIEDVLLVGERAGLVPGLAILAAAAQVGLCIHSAHLEPCEY